MLSTIKDYIKKNKKGSSNSVHNIIPWKGFRGNWVLLKDGYYRLITRVSPINLNNLTVDEIHKAVSALSEVLNSIQSSIQIKVSSEPLEIDEYENFVHSQAAKTDHAYFLERIYDYLDYIKERREKSSRQKKFYIIVKSEYTDMELVKDHFKNIIDLLQEILSSVGMKCIPLNEHEVKELLYKKLNPASSIDQPYDSDLDDVTILPSSIIYERNYIEVDGFYYRSFAIVHYPLGIEKENWFKKILETSGNVELDIFLTPGDSSEVEKEISNVIRRIDLTLDERIPEHRKVKLKKERESAEMMLNEIMDNQSYDVFTMITIYESSLEELNRQTKKIQGLIRSISMRSKPLTHRYLDPYFLHLPICYNSRLLQTFKWMMHSKVIASMMPFDNSEISGPTGSVWGINPDNDSFIIIDRFDRSRYNNGNGVTFGGSGSGKTFANMTEIDRNIVLGLVSRTVVIDPEGEFRFPYGQRISFEVGGSYCTNPFHIESVILDTDDEENDGEIHAGKYMLRKTSDIVSWFKWVYPEMSAEESSIISRAVRKTFQDAGIVANTEVIPQYYEHPTLSDFEKHIQNEPKLDVFRNVLEPYIHGEYASLFNGQTNWDLDNRLTVLDIQRLQEGVRGPVYDLLLKFISEEFKKDRDEPCALYMDEGHVMANPKNPQTLDFVVDCYKRFRKYSNYIELITQQVNDVLRMKDQAAQILANSTFKKYMYMKKSDAEALLQVENLSEKEIQFIMQRERQGRGIVIAEDQRCFFQSDASLDQLKFIAPKQYEKIMKEKEDEAIVV